MLQPERTVVLNLEETAIERVIPHRRGHVLSSSSRGGARDQMHERITRGESHGHLTLVACVAADADLQRRCPQFVLTKDASLTARERARMSALASPIQWFSGTSGWVTKENFPAILTALRRFLRQRRPGFEYVIVLDCAAQHVANDVLAHAARLGLHLLFVPARLTFLLQPLDTHVFSTLKLQLHREQLRARSGAAQGGLGPLEWIAILERTVTQVLVMRDWSRSFADNGVTGRPELARPRILEQAGVVLPHLGGHQQMLN